MKRSCSLLVLAPILLGCGILPGCGGTTDLVGSRPDEAEQPENNPDDAFGNRLGVPRTESQAAIDSAFQQLFFGDPEEQAVYREVGEDAAYIEDIVNNDVRTDSIGYGMFVTVQLGEQELFDKLWTWAKRYMLSEDPPKEGLLGWRCSTAGDECEMVAATDATTVIATTLFMAESSWGSSGAHDYRSDADMLIDAMVQTEQRNDGVVDNVQNPFDVGRLLPRRTSSASEEVFVKTDYLMPAFYEYWARWRPQDAEFWNEAAEVGRQTLQRAPMSGTGLIPANITVDGAPTPTMNYYDELAARTLLNRWFCYSWAEPQAWIVDQNVQLLDFFLEQGDYVSSYFLDGQVRGDRNTPAHLALVATAAAISDDPERHNQFLQALLDQSTPEGESRYYDGMLHLMSLLVVSGSVQAGTP